MNGLMLTTVNYESIKDKWRVNWLLNRYLNYACVGKDNLEHLLAVGLSPIGDQGKVGCIDFKSYSIHEGLSST